MLLGAMHAGSSCPPSSSSRTCSHDWVDMCMHVRACSLLNHEQCERRPDAASSPHICTGCCRKLAAMRLSAPWLLRGSNGAWVSNEQRLGSELGARATRRPARWTSRSRTHPVTRCVQLESVSVFCIVPGPWVSQMTLASRNGEEVRYMALLTVATHGSPSFKRCTLHLPFLHHCTSAGMQAHSKPIYDAYGRDTRMVHDSSCDQLNLEF